MPHVAEIERDIEATRARLDLTLDSLQHHASIAGLADDALGFLQDRGAGDFGRQIISTARANPLPVAMVALGIGWFLRELVAKPQPVRMETRPADRPGRTTASPPPAQSHRDGVAAAIDSLRNTRPQWEQQRVEGRY